MHPTHTPPTAAAAGGLSNLLAEPTPADILRGAAVYLTRYGWHQGAFYPLRYLPPFPPACAAGAIRAAVCGRPVRYLEGISRQEQRLLTRAERVLAAYLDDEYTDYETPFTVIGDWNDVTGRYLDEVIAALTGAADEWDRTHGGAR